MSTATFPDNPLLGPLSRADYITANYPLVVAQVRHYRAVLEAACIPFEDAISEGTVGLILAYDRHSRPDCAFSTFAVKYIRGYIRKMLRRDAALVRIPHNLYPLIQRIERDGLETATPAEIATEMDVSTTQAKSALVCILLRRPGPDTPHEKSGRTDDYSGDYTEKFVQRLKPKPQRVVRLLMADYTQTEVAQELGMTRQAVHITVKRVRENYETYEKLCG